jgi:hypothetical protein
MKTVKLLREGYAVVVILFFAFSTQAFTQIKATRVTDPKELAGKNGIVYNLPGTVVHVDLRIARTQQYTGPLAEYAADYLGLDNVITKDAVSYAIAGAAIRTVTEPDPNQVYIIEKEEKSTAEIWISFGNQSPVVALEKFDKGASPDGFMKWNEGLFVKPDPGIAFQEIY